MTPAGNLPAIGYVRVSTREQGDSGHGLAAQETAIREACERRGWRLVGFHQDIISSRRTRPGLAAAMGQARELGGLLVSAKVTRPARSTRELLALHEQAIAEGWQLVTLDLEHVDTSTPHGKAFLGMLAVFAEFERDLASERTVDGMAAAKKNGTRSGKAIGRPNALSANLPDGQPDHEARAQAQAKIDRLADLRASGLSINACAEALNSEGTTGLRGGLWTKKMVHHALRDYVKKGKGKGDAAASRNVRVIRDGDGSGSAGDGREPRAGAGDPLVAVAAHADRLDADADALEAAHEALLLDASRALRDSWSSEGKNYGSMDLKGHGRRDQNVNPFAFNGGNGNSWHYGPSGRLNLAEYRAVYLSIARGEDDAPALPGGVPAPPQSLVDDLERATELRLAAGAHRRHVTILSDGTDWAYDNEDRALARREVDALLKETVK